MRVLVTGATGNVGTAVLRRLAAEDEVTVTGVARRPPPPGAGYPYDGVVWRACDLGEPAAVGPLAEWLDGVDVVVHLAWQIQPSHDRGRLRRTNIDGSRNVLEAMRLAGVRRLVYASSVGAYALGPTDRRVTEEWPATGVPGSTYSSDKAAVEQLLDEAEAADPDLRIARLRTALVFQRDAGAQVTRTSWVRWRRSACSVSADCHLCPPIPGYGLRRCTPTMWPTRMRGRSTPQSARRLIRDSDAIRLIGGAYPAGFRLTFRSAPAHDRGVR